MRCSHAIVLPRFAGDGYNSISVAHVAQKLGARQISLLDSSWTQQHSEGLPSTNGESGLGVATLQAGVKALRGRLAIVSHVSASTKQAEGGPLTVDVGPDGGGDKGAVSFAPTSAKMAQHDSFFQERGSHSSV